MTRDTASLVAAADRHDADAFVAHLTPDVKSVFANTEPVIGRENVKKATMAFWDTIEGVSHHILAMHESGDTVTVQFDIEYHRKDGKAVTLPVCNVLVFDGDLVSVSQVYADLAPLYN
ncbi:MULTISPECIES: nuclear transport factor 2 family protein [unclassified Saccharopolyspora]|uniref:nuclear transport factor 2 family protein n=1 Tax=unclassified Saccharopolyspora TaxID=2646250 RepID=UPI001CD6F33B|nr:MULTISPECIES: nuclear transport factor 2 family protein [unclassified Saccharopolyspora]MCA1188488.1 nuclear transport factor 2 family protein [Saccharopolyspora sp. 6T]MCA1194143.1 nuclear transport factor 2 family protein [Saccharopolyspora sp. 6V]